MICIGIYTCTTDKGKLLLFGFLIIEVWDYDKVNPDDFLGRIVFPLCDIPATNNKEFTLPLKRKGVKDVVDGSIKIKLSLLLDEDTVC